ncbi:TonB-dependent receptor [Sphingobacterium wenxiniae]|uniref:Outer membrane receptor proteins, mostly Fe transport n=1 Tax=Sphingobacterium wenxiniae TaxID=683125 RepID=A0A1I6VPE4_9SPHI|nr:outer membrane beta-barrel family protein [Sphingobacterium wenxiniae]SFT15548.1 Outer membrane receptor proteins, mostly Fe transport [Sphingobacterium wenxiniae]
MNRFFIVLSFLLPLQVVLAQNSELSGIVKDSLSTTAIAYASVGLLDANNKVVDGMITDSSGNFNFSNLQSGKYNLTVKFIGYNQKRLAIEIRNQKTINLGNILISLANNNLEQVTVTAGMAGQKHSSDRQTYQASQYKNAVGGTALDIVKNLPSASVDAIGNISVRGNTGVIVLINGKPSLLDPATILNQIMANDVAEVEYITSPTAQFDPDGKGGIINLKTKKSATNGFAWTLNLQGGLPSIDDYNNSETQKRFGGDLAFQYRKDKLELNGSANYLRNDNAGFRDGDVNTVIGDRQTFFPSKGERSFDKYNFGIRLNSAYEISDKHSVNLGVLASRRFQDRVADIHYTNRTIRPSTDQEISKTNYFNPNLQNKQGKFYLLDFSYQYKINTAHSLQFGAIYEYADIYGSTKNGNIENGTDTVQWTYNAYTNPLQGLRLSLQHSWTLENADLLTGYQLRNDKQKGNFEYFASENGANNLELIPEFTGKLNATNTVHAFFTQYDRNFTNTQLSLGLRYEYYQRDLLLLNTNQKYPYSIHQLYPTFNLMHDLGSGWSWKLSTARRVQRNNNFELNPIPEREHSETLEQGDPELLPEFTTNAETGLVKKLKKSSIFLNVYYQHIKNPIQRVNSVYADTILRRVFTNADHASRYGIELGGESKALSWLKVNGGFNLYNYKISGQVLDYPEARTNRDWVYSINAGIQADFTKNWSTGLQVNYLSERPTVQGMDSRFLTPHFNLSKAFLKGAITAQLQWQFIELGDWGVNEQRITTFSNDFYTTTNYIYEKNVLLVNLSFNLYKLNQILKLPKSEFGEKEF